MEALSNKEFSKWLTEKQHVYLPNSIVSIAVNQIGASARNWGFYAIVDAIIAAYARINTQICDVFVINK